MSVSPSVQSKQLIAAGERKLPHVGLHLAASQAAEQDVAELMRIDFVLRDQPLIGQGLGAAMVGVSRCSLPPRNK